MDIKYLLNFKGLQKYSSGDPVPLKKTETGCLSHSIPSSSPRMRDSKRSWRETIPMLSGNKYKTRHSFLSALVELKKFINLTKVCLKFSMTAGSH